MLSKDTRRQLVRRHFKTEKGGLGANTLFLRDAILPVTQPALRRIEGDVGGKRGLAHARASGKDDKVGIMQAAAFGVYAVEACGHARKMSTRIQGLFDIFDRLGRCGKEAFHASGFAFALGNLVKLRLCLFDLRLGVDNIAGVERSRH